MWKQKEKDQIEREDKLLERTLEKKKGHRDERSPPSKHQGFYRLQDQDDSPVFQMPTHTEASSLKAGSPSQARCFWVQSPDSGETKGSQFADSLSGCWVTGPPNLAESAPMAS